MSQAAGRIMIALGLEGSGRGQRENTMSESGETEEYLVKCEISGLHRNV
jgi:hypothetical protein